MVTYVKERAVRWGTGGLVTLGMNRAVSWGTDMTMTGAQVDM